MFKIRQGVEGRKIFADLLKKAIDRFEERFLPKATLFGTVILAPSDLSN